MIGFIKWLFIQYRKYKIEQTFKTLNSQENKERHFKDVLMQCEYHGFTIEQMMYILNLVAAAGKI